ncbi:MAG: glutamine--fructose-6-phosphate transaminase (isomerizing) [Gammaproteobacteria bacterium]|jgi:glucosamine--fructose-6-phosphate aminotransferase (isomerizing)|nr:MAG: glutamine--fructose-6-phosphate transaminase (isomerizing) [Gammaproteobacteria bacterium]
MCGIVGAVAQRDVSPILIEGLRRLEYRGYDSAGIAILGQAKQIQRRRVLGKVSQLALALGAEPLNGGTGIAHTRWATHGKPSVDNAHPHVSRDEVALVHNGIIENHLELKERQIAIGYTFYSQTDTEVVANQVHHFLKTEGDLLHAVHRACQMLKGAYALGVISASQPNLLVATRSGSPLVIGVGIGEHFIASDVFALLPVTQRFIILQEGDFAEISKDQIKIFNKDLKPVERPIITSSLSAEVADKSGYRHYMLKEIFTQPRAVADTLEGCLSEGHIVEQSFGMVAGEIFDKTRAVQIVACGTSYHAGLIAGYWLESIAGIPCRVEVASEFRYRKTARQTDTLFVAISQSGETADTLAALGLAKSLNYVGTLGICNVPESTLTREAELVFLTHAGPEIGVASTKAFTTQLTALLLLVTLLSRRTNPNPSTEQKIVGLLESLPGRINLVLELNRQLEQIAQSFAGKHHALYLGRGTMLPVAMEGALKLKEISYIHAEAYPAGELKHGPLALVDDDMPVIAIAPNNQLLEKLKSNLQEVRARNGELYVFADAEVAMESSEGIHVIPLVPVDDTIAPIIYTIPLQLFAYHVAVTKGADVDQPRNLAKSVTVE